MSQNSASILNMLSSAQYSTQGEVLENYETEENVEIVIVKFENADLEIDVSTINLHNEDIENEDGDIIVSEDDAMIETVEDIRNEDHGTIETVDDIRNENNVIIEAVDSIKTEDFGDVQDDIVDDDDENTMDALDSDMISDNFAEREGEVPNFKFITMISDQGNDSPTLHQPYESGSELTLKPHCIMYMQEGNAATFGHLIKTERSELSVQYGSPGQSGPALSAALSDILNSGGPRGRHRKAAADLIMVDEQGRRICEDLVKREAEDYELYMPGYDVVAPVFIRRLKGPRSRPRPPDSLAKPLADSPYQCGLCGKAFTRKFSLTSHLSVHNQTSNYKCPCCGKFFIQMCHLKDHVRAHGGLKPNACGQCDKRFTRFSDLKRHMGIHLGLKPFSCDVCSKLFASRHGLTYHLRTHKGIRPWECGLCDKKFVQKSTLLTHIKAHARGDSGRGRPQKPLRSRGRAVKMEENVLKEEEVGMAEEIVEEHQEVNEIQEEIEI